VRALRFHGPGDLRLEEVADPEPGPGDVLVRVEVALTDGTDLKAFRRGHPVLLGELPSPFGHEFCGIDIATGRRVVAANSDGNRGNLELLNGAYAELLVVPEPIARANLLRVPDGLAPEVAALLEPLACCLHGVDRAGILGGETVAVLGAGPIGLMLCACLRDAGATPIVVGGRPERRALVAEFGGRTGDGEGADVAVDAAGTVEAWRRAVGLVRRGGTVVLFGGLPAGEQVPLDAQRLHYDELTILGAFHHTPRTVRAALAFLASGAYPWRRLLTHEIRLEDVPALFADPPRDYLKAVVRP
jgi:L-iditol 2-dehydrogenase